MAAYQYNKYERETIINMNDADNFATISTYQSIWINRLRQLAEDRPNDVKIIQQSSDMIEVQIPKSFIKIKAPRVMTEEQREAAIARLKPYQKKKM